MENIIIKNNFYKKSKKLKYKKFHINKRLKKNINNFDLKKKYRKIKSIYSKSNAILNKNNFKRFNTQKLNKKKIYWDINNMKTNINFLKYENKTLNIKKLRNVNKYNKINTVTETKYKINNDNLKNKFKNQINIKINNLTINIEKFNLEKKKIEMILKSIDNSQIIKNNNNKFNWIKNIYNIYFKKINKKFLFNEKDYIIKNEIIFSINRMHSFKISNLINDQNKIIKYRHMIKNEINLINKLDNLKNKEFIKLVEIKKKQKNSIYENIKYKLSNLTSEKLIILNNIKDKENKIEKRQNLYFKEKKILDDKFNKIRNENKDLKIKIKKLLSKNENNNINNEENKLVKFNLNFNKDKIQKIKSNKRIEFKDIKIMIKELKFNLLLKGFSINKIISFLIKKNKEVVSIKELIQRINKEPFNVKSIDDCTKLARFLIEDNSKEIIKFSKEKINSIHIIKSILKNLFNPMDFPLKIEFDLIYKKWSSFFNKNYNKFLVFRNINEKGIYITFDDLLYYYKKLNYKLLPKEINFLEISLYYLYDNSFKINFNDLKILFNPENKSNIINKFENIRKKSNKERKQTYYTNVFFSKEKLSNKFKFFEKKKSLSIESKNSYKSNLLLNI